MNMSPEKLQNLARSLAEEGRRAKLVFKEAAVILGYISDAQRELPQTSMQEMPQTAPQEMPQTSTQEMSQTSTQEAPREALRRSTSCLCEAHLKCVDRNSSFLSETPQAAAFWFGRHESRQPLRLNDASV